MEHRTIRHERPRQHTKLTRKDVQAIRQLWTEGKGTTGELGHRFGVSQVTIWKIVNNVIWHDPHYKPPAEPPHGRHGGWPSSATNGNARLTWEQVHLIRYRYKAGGITQQTLADEYGVQKMAISSIIRNVSWHDPDYTPPQR